MKVPRLEGLAQRQPEVTPLRPAQRRRERIGRDLQHGDAASQHEQAQQHQAVDRDFGGEQHQQAAGDHHAQRDEHGRHGLAPRQQHRGGKAHHPVGDKEGRRAQLGFQVGEAEDALHGRDQWINQGSDEPPGEEQAGDDGERSHRVAGRLPTLITADVSHLVLPFAQRSWLPIIADSQGCTRVCGISPLRFEDPRTRPRNVLDLPVVGGAVMFVPSPRQSDRCPRCPPAWELAACGPRAWRSLRRA